MTNNQLGRLEQVSLRDIWVTEDRHFTPWLAGEENLSLLGDTLGIELALESTEQSVGPFSADILCKNTADDSWVLIENQLEKTDHTHLGQLLTYASGLQAVTIVWISSRMTEEHRAALDWLNEITAKDFNFFGLEIECWKIGNSTVAPKFNMVSKPNEWARTVSRNTTQRSRSELSELQKTQLDFWTDFRDYVGDNETQFKVGNPLAQNYMNVGIGRSGIGMVAIASYLNTAKNTWHSNELRTELYLWSEDAKGHYEQLLAMKDSIEGELNKNLIWHNDPEVKSCRIYTRKEPININDKTKWPEYFAWLSTELDDFYTYFKPIITSLEP